MRNAIKRKENPTTKEKRNGPKEKQRKQERIQNKMRKIKK